MYLYGKALEGILSQGANKLLPFFLSFSKVLFLSVFRQRAMPLRNASHHSLRYASWRVPFVS